MRHQTPRSSPPGSQIFALNQSVHFGLVGRPHPLPQDALTSEELKTGAARPGLTRCGTIPSESVPPPATLHRAKRRLSRNDCARKTWVSVFEQAFKNIDDVLRKEAFAGEL